MNADLFQQTKTESRRLSSVRPSRQTNLSFEDNRSATCKLRNLAGSIQRMAAHLAINPDKTKTYAGTIVENPPVANAWAIDVAYLVNVYEKTIPPKDKRLDAINEASIFAAEVGSRIFNRPAGSQEYAIKKKNRKYVDPFIFRVKTSHKNQSAQEPWRSDGLIPQDHDANRTLELDYQMAQPWTGYVIRVKDGEHEGQMVPVDPRNIPPNVTDPRGIHTDLRKRVSDDISDADKKIHEMRKARKKEFAPDDLRLLDMQMPLHKERASLLTTLRDTLSDAEQGKGTAHNSKYTNIHDHNNKNISEQITTDKFYAAEGDLHESYDAITKLAGEGARFICVRNNMEKIRDDSIIYHTDSTTRQDYGIAFSLSLIHI